MSRRVRMRERVLGLVLGCVLGAGAWAAAPERVDINTADAATLARVLEGVGPARAAAIVEHRRRHGPFRRAEDLARVKGIGPRTVERNRGRIAVGARGSGGAKGRER